MPCSDLGTLLACTRHLQRSSEFFWFFAQLLPTPASMFGHTRRAHSTILKCSLRGCGSEASLLCYSQLGAHLHTSLERLFIDGVKCSFAPSQCPTDRSEILDLSVVPRFVDADLDLAREQTASLIVSSPTCAYLIVICTDECLKRVEIVGSENWRIASCDANVPEVVKAEVLEL